MFDTRNVGYLKADFEAGADVTAFIFDEIRKRHPGWSANVLQHLELVSDKPLSLTVDGWEWQTNGYWPCNNAVIRNVVVNEAVTGLQMAFRYDD